MSTNLAAIVLQKEKKLIRTRDKILSLDDEIKKVSSNLKEKRSMEKSLRVSTMRNIAHVKTMQLDGTRRPPDRQNEIRTYSKMDMDIWKYNEMRDWFNKDSPDPITYTATPADTGYMIRID